jgi:hypothetical protein
MDATAMDLQIEKAEMEKLLSELVIFSFSKKN